MIVRANPNIDTPHPIHVTIKIASLAPLCKQATLVYDTSSNKAKLLSAHIHKLDNRHTFALLIQRILPLTMSQKTSGIEVAKLNKKDLLN